MNANNTVCGIKWETGYSAVPHIFRPGTLLKSPEDFATWGELSHQMQIVRIRSLDFHGNKNVPCSLQRIIVISGASEKQAWWFGTNLHYLLVNFILECKINSLQQSSEIGWIDYIKRLRLLSPTSAYSWCMALALNNGTSSWVHKVQWFQVSHAPNAW